ncbi:hypothetical protein BH09ACT8_BH09ACT8_15000 [soil metagenome]
MVITARRATRVAAQGVFFGEKEGDVMTAAADRRRTVAPTEDQYLRDLELATRGLLALNVSVLQHLEKRIGLEPLRALQALRRRGPSMVTELGDDLGLLSSTASRLSDRLAEAGYITRGVSPTNRRATLLELTDAGHAVLEELIELRVGAFGEVIAAMRPADRAALLRGTHAFTAAHDHLAEVGHRQRDTPTE